MATWSFSQDFAVHFQASRSDLISKLDASPTSLKEIQALTIEIAKLSKSLVDATGSLPTYDQRQCELQLKSLEASLEELRNTAAPKSKFAFKRKAPVAPKPSTSPPVPGHSQITPPEASPPSNNTHISAQSHKYITLNSLPLSPNTSSDITLSDMTRCIINLLPQSESPTLQISALHIRNISASILILPIIPGSILIHNVNRCTIVVGCHQFRMHNSEAVDVYLSIPSNPIIEHCKGIRFAGYPPNLNKGQATPPTSNYLSVQDFSHIRATPSPNWSPLSPPNTTQWPTAPIPDTELETTFDLEPFLPPITIPSG